MRIPALIVLAVILVVVIGLYWWGMWAFMTWLLRRHVDPWLRHLFGLDE